MAKRDPRQAALLFPRERTTLPHGVLEQVLDEVAALILQVQAAEHAMKRVKVVEGDDDDAASS